MLIKSEKLIVYLGQVQERSLGSRLFLFIVRLAYVDCNLAYLTFFTGQRDGTGFPGNDKNLSRERRSGKNGKLQALILGTFIQPQVNSFHYGCAI